jgi:hypothetical protein
LAKDAVLGPQGLYVALREVGMELDLVHRGHHAGAVEQASEVIDHEVADPDRAHLAVGEQGFQRPVRLQRRVELRGQRPASVANQDLSVYGSPHPRQSQVLPAQSYLDGSLHEDERLPEWTSLISAVLAFESHDSVSAR